MIYVYVKGGFKFKCQEAYGNGDDALNYWMSDLAAPNGHPSYEDDQYDTHFSDASWTIFPNYAEYSWKEHIPHAVINIAQSLHELETGSYNQARKEIVVFHSALTGKEIAIRRDDIVAITDASDK